MLTTNDFHYTSIIIIDTIMHQMLKVPWNSITHVHKRDIHLGYFLTTDKDTSM